MTRAVAVRRRIDVLDGLGATVGLGLLGWTLVVGPDVRALAVGITSLVLLVLARMRSLHRELHDGLQRERTLRRANDRLVATLDVAEVRRVLVDAAERLLTPGVSRLWVVEDPHLAGFVAPDGATGRVHLVRSPQGLHSTLNAPDDAILVVGELPVSTSPQLALVAAVPTAPSPQARWALDTLVQCAALAVDRVSLNEQAVHRRGQERLQRLLQDASDIVTVVDQRLVVRYVTPAVERVLGRTTGDTTGTSWLSLVHEDDREAARSLVERSNVGWPSRGELRLVAGDGSTRYVDVAASRVDDADGGGFTIACHDVTQRHELEQQLTHQAFHDTLTGLANRALFQNRLRHTVERSRRTGARFAVLFIDLDDFKTVNDSLGHAAGDALLRTVGTRLEGNLRDQDTAARLGGDEFAVILEDVDDHEQVVHVAARLIDVLAQPVEVGGEEVPVGASVGIAFGGTADDDPERLMRDADLALFQAKGAGKGQSAVYAPAMHETASDRLQLKAELRRAVEQGELVVRYQPWTTLVDERVVGVEALVRWEHPTRGTLEPATFLGLAEETGLVVPVGRQVLTTALAAAARWQRLPGRRGLTIAVNLSARQLLDPDLVETVRSALATSQVDPSTVVLEIIENVLAPDGGVPAERLDELADLGVRLYIDDFGTGYSSLARLHQLPVHGLKLARQFVAPLPGTTADSGLVRTILDLAATVGLDDVVPEGVETEAQRAALVELGYRVGQGHLLSRPVDEDGVRALLVRDCAVDEPIGLSATGTTRRQPVGAASGASPSGLPPAGRPPTAPRRTSAAPS